MAYIFLLSQAPGAPPPPNAARTTWTSWQDNWRSQLQTRAQMPPHNLKTHYRWTLEAPLCQTWHKHVWRKLFIVICKLSFFKNIGFPGLHPVWLYDVPWLDWKCVRTGQQEQNTETCMKKEIPEGQRTKRSRLYDHSEKSHEKNRLNN